MQHLRGGLNLQKYNTGKAIGCVVDDAVLNTICWAPAACWPAASETWTQPEWNNSGKCPAVEFHPPCQTCCMTCCQALKHLRGCFNSQHCFPKVEREKAKVVLNMSAMRTAACASKHALARMDCELRPTWATHTYSICKGGSLSPQSHVRCYAYCSLNCDSLCTMLFAATTTLHEPPTAPALLPPACPWLPLPSQPA
jgi:hypothetical protein